MKNLLSITIVSIFISFSGYGLFKAVTRADNICKDYQSSGGSYRDCIGIWTNFTIVPKWNDFY